MFPKSIIYLLNVKFLSRSSYSNEEFWFFIWFFSSNSSFVYMIRSVGISFPPKWIANFPIKSRILLNTLNERINFLCLWDGGCEPKIYIAIFIENPRPETGIWNEFLLKAETSGSHSPWAFQGALTECPTSHLSFPFLCFLEKPLKIWWLGWRWQHFGI